MDGGACAPRVGTGDPLCAGPRAAWVPGIRLGWAGSRPGLGFNGLKTRVCTAQGPRFNGFGLDQLGWLPWPKGLVWVSSLITGLGLVGRPNGFGLKGYWVRFQDGFGLEGQAQGFGLEGQAQGFGPKYLGFWVWVVSTRFRQGRGQELPELRSTPLLNPKG